MKNRLAAVAGMFYPSDTKELQNTVHNMLTYAKADYPAPKALIAPHAGYIYSGEVAASAYACLTKIADKIKRVVLLGPAHRYPFRGVAFCDADYFVTPLGLVKVDEKAFAEISTLPQVSILNEAHLHEHCLEVQLPFLQALLKDFTIVPLLASLIQPAQVAAVLEKLWGGEETLIVISSDLSHYHPYLTAQKLDRAAADAILNLTPSEFKDEQACGYLPIKALLQIAKQKNLHPFLIDLRNSGDTSGTKDQVVGYGAFHFVEDKS